MKTQKPKSNLREWTESILIAIVLALFIRTFIVQAFKIPSGSMIPTLQIGDHILVNKLSYGVRMPFLEKYLLGYATPQRGDVVVFIFPEDDSKDFIKRVVGVAGDTVEVRAKKVFINGKPVEDPHAYFAGYDPQSGGAGSGDADGVSASVSRWRSISRPVATTRNATNRPRYTTLVVTGDTATSMKKARNAMSRASHSVRRV